jgi:putative two-component system response regulator
VNSRLAKHSGPIRILVLDDEETNLRLLRRILEKAGYDPIETLSDGSDIENVVEKFKPHLMLLDLHMPAPDGFAVLQTLSSQIHGPQMLPVLVLTGDASTEAKRRALSLGARDFLAKPFDSQEALLRIRNLLETRFLYGRLAEQNAELESRVLERTSELMNSQMEVLERLARAGEIRDDETGRHTQRVGELSGAIAEAFGLDQSIVNLVNAAAPLHDVGKIGIPDAILLKPGPLTPEETALMRLHTTIGAKILSGGKSDVITMAERIARSHHERWDGSGYPDNAFGEQIPIEARIVALADCVDALTHNRPYRPSWPLHEVLVEIQRTSGSHFDPEIVRVFMQKCKGKIVASSPHPWKALGAAQRAAQRLA